MYSKNSLFLITSSILLFTVSLFSIADTPSEPEISADYRATPEQLLERYPYAVMSYLSEMDSILTSGEQGKQVFIIFRLSYLGSLGIQLIADPLAIPEKWRRHFIDTQEKTITPGQKSHQIIGQLSIPDSTIKVRIFKQTKDLAADADHDQENKIILALSGEKSNKAFQCLITEIKPLRSDRSDCSLSLKQLQNITELAESFKQLYPYHSLEVTGYSYSGAVAQVVMLSSEAIDRAYIFNSFGTHPSWIKTMPGDKLANIHHSYIEGSFIYGQGYNLVSRYSRWRLPQNKVVVPGMKISSSGHESQIRKIYQLNHRDSWLDTLYNFTTNGWILHSKESVLRAFEAHLNLNFPW
ncbi:hypothetical protein [Endozoicomonas sp.]|uniref:hypothetical protein n=1 Tax=Endozoicomonas sp. TaxID=1892382 RepID=UPI002884351F|nr:hypothetical protein [Endozoicomonas sp.]